GDYVMLAVTDNGLGMNEETRAKVFEPFFTTKQEGKGTGLGLATVYGIVRQSGGYTTVESKLGKGTTFRVYLPRAEAAEFLPEEESPPVQEQVLRGTETVLVVEDEDGLRKLICESRRSSAHTQIRRRYSESSASSCAKRRNGRGASTIRAQSPRRRRSRSMR